MSFSLLTIVIFGLTAAIIYKEIRKGYKHGLSRSLINLATLIFCAVFSSIVSMLVAMLLGTFLMAMFREIGLFDFLVGELIIFDGVIEMLLKMLLSVLLFLVAFYSLKNLVLRLVQTVVRVAGGKIKRSKKTAKNLPEYLSEDEVFYVKHDKKLGAAVGALCGLILAIIVFMPLTGILKTSNEIVDIIYDMTARAQTEEKEKSEEELAEAPDMIESTEIEVLEESEEPAEPQKIEKTKELQLLERYANDASGTVLYSCGGKALFNLTASTHMHGYTTYLNKEIKIFESIDLIGLQKELQASQGITTENSDLLESLLDDTKESLALKIVMSQVVQRASENWLERLPYLGIDRPSFGGYYELDGFFDSILFVCSTTTVETYDADIRTVVGLITIFEEDEVFSGERDYDSFMKAFVEGDTLKRVEDELYKNPNMHTVNLAIDDLIMSIFASELMDDTKYTLEQKMLFYKEIAAIMSDSQGLDGSVQLIAISNGISDSFESLGMYLPESLETRVATIFTANIPTDEQVSEDDVEEMFGKYEPQS